MGMGVRVAVGVAESAAMKACLCAVRAMDVAIVLRSMVGVNEGVGDGVLVREGAVVDVAVAVVVAAGVFVNVGVKLAVAVDVSVGVCVNVSVGRGVRVGDGVHVGRGVYVGVRVHVGMGVRVAVGVADSAAMNACLRAVLTAEVDAAALLTCVGDNGGRVAVPVCVLESAGSVTRVNIAVPTDVCV